MKKQLMIFLNAVMFYTRIPVPSWMTHDEEMLNKATIYFPVIGWIVGGITHLAAKLSADPVYLPAIQELNFGNWEMKA